MALTGAIKTIRFGVPGNSTQPVGIRAIAASTTVYGGTICLTNSAGAIKNASSPASTDTCWGLVLRDTVNASTTAQTAGIIQDVIGKPFEVQTGSFYLLSAGSGDQLSQATIGKTVYVYDEQTVAATSNTNARPVAGVHLDCADDGIHFAIKMGSNESAGAP